MNKQQLLFIQSMFQNEPLTNGGQTIMINVKDKYEGIPYKLEVSADTIGRFLLFRVHTSDGVGLWGTWESKEEVEKWFKAVSLI